MLDLFLVARKTQMIRITFCFIFFLAFLRVFIAGLSSEANTQENFQVHKAKHSAGGHSKKHKRIAALWTFTSKSLPSYFELTVATLVNGGADNVDVHILIPEIPSKFAESGKLGNQVFFHKVTGEEWSRRIREKLQIEINYNVEKTAKKIADLKPMLGLLFSDIIPESIYSFWVFGDCDGFFGSYNHAIDYSMLPNYDVISGYPEISSSSGVAVFAGSPVRSTGGWTMWRNNAKINTLFMRSLNWKDVVQRGDEVFAFDESTRPSAPGEESISKVLEFSTDIRQCYFHRIPQVRKAKNSIFIAEMVSHINEKPGGMLYFRWQKGVGINLTVDGPYGWGDVNRTETVRPLFFHFLGWKYSCWTELEGSMNAFLTSVTQLKMTVFDISCFEFTSSMKRFVWKLC